MPHDVQEYVLANTDRYPGYLLSGDPHSLQSVTLNQAKHCLHDTLGQDGEWVAPSSYASLHEQSLKRGLKKAYYANRQHKHYSKDPTWNLAKYYVDMPWSWVQFQMSSQAQHQQQSSSHRLEIKFDTIDRVNVI